MARRSHLNRAMLLLLLCLLSTLALAQQNQRTTVRSGFPQ